jgi:glutamate--cysteine ligase
VEYQWGDGDDRGGACMKVSMREKIIKNYIDFFAAGCKAPDDLKYGLEAEHFIVYRETQKTVPYFGENGVCELLHELSPNFAEEYWIDGHLLGLFNDEAAISLEPGSQLEISITHAADLAAMAAVYQKYYLIIKAAVERRGQEIITAGYQPETLVHDIELLPKKRYTYMNEHFKKTGTRGINMMRGTASCQVAIDYTDEGDFIAKYQSACVLIPLLSLVSSNSPRFEGQDNDNLLIRTEIWRNVDPERSCLIPTTFDPDFSFRKYAEYTIDQAAIFEIADNIAINSERRVSEVLGDHPVWDEDYLLYLSLIFPDVRVRQYIEIRVADSMPAEQTFAYMALLKGLFGDINGLQKWLQKFPHSIAAVNLALDAIMERGFEAIVYGEPVTDLLNQMFELALKQLKNEEKDILVQGFGQHIIPASSRMGARMKKFCLPKKAGREG